MLLLLRGGDSGRRRSEHPSCAGCAALMVAVGCLGRSPLTPATLRSGVHQGDGGCGLTPAWRLPSSACMLVEQLFRNAADDSRWNAKPLCLGLGCVFAFDFYLMSEAICSPAATPDALSVRGGVHAVSVPLLLLASQPAAPTGCRDLRISRVAAFHSTALLLAGAYLLFIVGDRLLRALLRRRLGRGAADRLARSPR